MDTKTILNDRVAKYLEEKGFKIIRTEPSHKYEGVNVFIFESTPKLRAEIKKLRN
ncbi:DUF5659 domain-containing protein [Sutcliffiella horikoshii]|uniref:DUF5659 domain-containing protein n=1 Tax=Sutcliffiella horikoshii TaxID=79883 RepID=UPI00384C9782